MTISVDPNMLKWVRRRAGLNPAELAAKVGVRQEKVYEWESYGRLTLKQAEKVAEQTHAPFGYLFLDEPPVEELPISDFRTLGSTAVKTISLDLRETIELSLVRQDWYSEYAIS